MNHTPYHHIVVSKSISNQRFSFHFEIFASSEKYTDESVKQLVKEVREKFPNPFYRVEVIKYSVRGKVCA